MPRARRRLVWGKKRRSGQRPQCCRPGFRIWCAPGTLYGLEECVPRKATSAEQLRGKVPVPQFGRMCQKLGIRILAASSPQAKGRVERIHGVHQDRLIKKLRRKGIDSYAGSERVSGKRVPAGAQPTFYPAGGKAGGLSRAKADGPRASPDFPHRDRANDQQRLGDPAREPFSANCSLLASGAMGPRKARHGCVNGRTEPWKCTTGESE